MKTLQLFFAVLALLSLHPLPSLAAKETRLEMIGIYNIQSLGKKTEIVSIQKKPQRIALSCSSKDIVDILSIAIPAKHRFCIVSKSPMAGRSVQWPSIQRKIFLQWPSSTPTLFPQEAYRSMMLPLGSCLRPWPLVYVAAYPVTGPVDFVRNNITGCLNHNIGQAALCGLEFDRSKSRGRLRNTLGRKPRKYSSPI